MAAEEGFRYPRGISATNVFYYGDNGRLGVLKWEHTGVDDPILPAKVYSSCQGLVACRCNATSTYRVGNPFLSDTLRNIILRYYVLPDPPTFHFPEDTHVVLALVPSPAFLVFCALLNGDNVFTVETFNSASSHWEPFMSRIDQRFDVRIVPNSGVSCGRFGFWLLCDSTRTPTYVLTFQFRDAFSPKSVASFLSLPPGVRGAARMQLGRAMGGLGLVVVNEARSRVELYTLNTEGDSGESVWPIFELFNLEVRADEAAAAAENGDGSVARWRQEDMTMVCREMPRPIRFDSLKVELLFWVQGRVLLLVNSSVEPHVYRMTVLPGDWPASIADGLPHVCTHLLPFDFGGVW